MTSRADEGFDLPGELAKLPPSWRYVPLGKLVNERGISYGVVQPGDFDPLGVPIIRVNNIKGRRIDSHDVLRVSPAVEAQYDRTRLKGGEVLLTLVGSLGECAVVGPELVGWNVARAVGVIPVDAEVTPQWVALTLRSNPLQHLIHTWATTTVQATLNLRDVAKLPIPVPPREEREAITHVLGTLDDKIEINRRMNETLEAMARAIFKSWFVDFDPVRAKGEGRKPEGMDAETAALFPNGFEESALGMIPRGWKAGVMGDVIEIHDSRRIPLSNRERAKRQGSYRYYGAAGVIDHVDEFLFDGIFVLVGEDGSVVNSDGTPVVQHVWGKFWVNNHAHVLTARAGFRIEQLLLLLQQVQVLPFVTGAVQPKLNQANLRRIPVIVPSAQTSEAFNTSVASLYRKLRSNDAESTTLTAIRDALLPKLLSGEIRVGEAERTLDAAQSGNFG